MAKALPIITFKPLPTQLPKQSSPIINYLLTDTTLPKASHNKTHRNHMKKILKSKQSTLTHQKAVRILAENSRKIQETWKTLQKTELTHFLQKNAELELSATKIQKIVRGFLIRTKIDSIILSQRESFNTSTIKDLKNQTDLCMLTLGSNIIPVIITQAVLIIQGAYRRFLFRRKLKIMRQCYQQWLNKRKGIIQDYLREIFIGFNCKLKRANLLFLKDRMKRLLRIKRNLAILAVKRFWRTNKFTFKILKDKLFKDKRKKAAIQNKELNQELLDILGDDKKESNCLSSDIEMDEKIGRTEKEEEKIENQEEDREVRRIKEKAEKWIREKLAMSKKAYAIAEITTKVVMPLIQERALNERAETDFVQNDLRHLTASVFAKGKALNHEKNIEVCRNTQISAPIVISQRKHNYSSSLPPLILLSPSQTSREPHSEIQIPRVLNSHFLSPTLSSEKKQSPPIIFEYNQPFQNNSKKFSHRHPNYLKLPKSIQNPNPKPKPKQTPSHWIRASLRYSNNPPSLNNPFSNSPPPNHQAATNSNKKSFPKRTSNTTLQSSYPDPASSSLSRRDHLPSLSPSTQDYSFECPPINY